MSEDRLTILDRAAALRDAFDRSFAAPPPPDPTAPENLLAIRVGSEPYALRLSEIAGLYSDRKITPIPGDAPALIGIAGFRGAILPVYDLHVLLGHRTVADTRWLVMAARAPLAFAFANHEGQLSVGPDAIVRHQSDGPSRSHVREFVRTPGLVRAIADLSSLLDAVRRQVPAKLNMEER